ncbi:hypothetical protein [Rhodoferax antarcticus]|uniref:hypothetical protein n=1 Tax=Rhodoferax antarcticus TaxID=81479 RepID=UPI00111518B1|nr:hypothetical protein [Rhodoferax antarcticus]
MAIATRILPAQSIKRQSAADAAPAAKGATAAKEIPVNVLVCARNLALTATMTRLRAQHPAVLFWASLPNATFRDVDITNQAQHFRWPFLKGIHHVQISLNL